MLVLLSVHMDLRASGWFGCLLWDPVSWVLITIRDPWVHWFWDGCDVPQSCKLQAGSSQHKVKWLFPLCTALVLSSFYFGKTAYAYGGWLLFWLHLWPVCVIWDDFWREPPKWGLVDRWSVHAFNTLKFIELLYCSTSSGPPSITRLFGAQLICAFLL